jgi:hypothetical protein
MGELRKAQTVDAVIGQSSTCRRAPRTPEEATPDPVLFQMQVEVQTRPNSVRPPDIDDVPPCYSDIRATISMFLSFGKLRLNIVLLDLESLSPRPRPCSACAISHT